MSLLTTMLLPQGLIFAVIGFLLKKFPPPINIAVGYRTPSSKRNADTWAVANSYSATLLMICGAALTILGIISLFLPDMDITGMFIGIGILMVVLTGIIAATEIHLYKVFDKNGNRRA
jgi:uncharacterized membrane protein